MNQLSIELKDRINELGADKVGFADLHEISPENRYNLRYGISIIKVINPRIINSIYNGPNQEYYNEYKRLNSELNEIAVKTSNMIKDLGYQSIALTTTEVSIDVNNRSTNLPHKTVGTRSGLGWIGKCALLITPEYGAAIRLTTVLTDLRLDTGMPINDSKCGNCTICKEVCSGDAVKGVNWNIGLQREDYYNAMGCRKEARRKSGLKGIKESLCGLCIYICPYTRRYIELSGVKG